MTRIRSALLLLLLLLVTTRWSAHAATPAEYSRQHSSTLTGTPALETPVASDGICGILCAQNDACHAFSRDGDGVCRIHLQPNFVSTTGDSGTRSYRLTGPSKCPGGFLWCSGASLCLLRISGYTSFTSAVAACSALGARITVPRSIAHNQCLDDFYNGNHFWLGAVDANRDGVYEGTDGNGPVPEDPSWWGANERNHPDATSNPEPNVIFLAGSWADAPDDHQSSPMCEADQLH